MAFALLVMPDDRPASRWALRRYLIRYWRGGQHLGPRWQRRMLSRYHGAQRWWIQIGAAMGIYFVRGGWWQLPLAVVVFVTAIVSRMV
jgi:hypothetical protein